MDIDIQRELIQEVRALERQLSWIAGLLTVAFCVGLFFFAGQIAHAALSSLALDDPGGWISSGIGAAVFILFWWYLTALRERD